MLSFASAAAAASLSDGYLIDCGSNVGTVFENRTYSADLNSSSVSVSAASFFFANDENPGGKDRPPLYRTARVFSNFSSYHFHELKNGTYFLRLHFSPFQHPDFKRFQAFTSENYDLAGLDFQVLVAQVPVFNYSSVTSAVLIHEFIVHANPNSTLTLSFKPSSIYAFVSAIELVSAPTGLLPDSVNHEFNLSEYILETVHRVNVGGPEIAPTSDPLFRKWTSDINGTSLLLQNSAKPVNYSGSLSYQAGLSTIETAPTGVYISGRKPVNLNTWSQYFNVTWIFDQILPDSHYMIRLHFCDIISESFSDLDFNIYINFLTAKDSFQPGNMTNHRPHTPLYVDFVAKTNPGDGLINISISPVDISSQKAILNGVEILRMVRTGSSKTHQPLKKRIILIALVTSGSILVLLAFATTFILLRKRHKVLQKDGRFVVGRNKDEGEGTSVYSHGTTLTYGSPSLHQNFGLMISFEDIRLATHNFDEGSIIGHGGFGNVYSGVLKDGTRVAVKRANPDSRQGLKEFQAEIMVLSGIRHKHLVSLIGYCAEESEMILVYEFMELGPLQKHLYGSSDLPTLSWTQRLEICIGAAKGLHYLHTGSTQSIIHRDVKSSNILLDEDYTAKVADFGLSKLGPTYSQTHVSTMVKGSFGYMDPEYFKRHQLTEKSDVYSFGVVLLETLSAMRAVDIGRPNGEQSIVEWKLKLHKKGQMDKLVDPRIKEEVHPSALRNFLETAVKCLAEDGVNRPAMGEVLWDLEYVLRLQQTAMGRREPHEDSNPAVASFGNGVPRMPSTRVGNGGVEGGDCSDSESGLSSSRIFSQLITDQGR